MGNNDNYFNILNNINVNEFVEKKNGLTYLSWAHAWKNIKTIYPNANYKIYENTLPNGFVANYFTDGKTCWVKTGVTINDIEHIEYLPVMDYRNKSISFDNVTSFDVNKAIQRSLTKACARHGLGLYIYAGEDLPEQETKTIDKKSAIIIKRVIEDVYKEETEEIIKKLLVKYKIKSLERLTEKQYADLLVKIIIHKNINELKNNKN